MGVGGRRSEGAGRVGLIWSVMCGWRQRTEARELDSGEVWVCSDGGLENVVLICDPSG